MNPSPTLFVCKINLLDMLKVIDQGVWFKLGFHLTVRFA